MPAHICTNAYDVHTTALLDTGANTRSYIGKVFLESQLTSVPRTPVRRTVRLGGSDTTLSVDFAVMLPISLASPKGGKHSALLTFDIIDTDIKVIVGLPDLCLHFADLVHDVLLAIGQKLNLRLEAPALLALEEAETSDPGSPTTLHPAWTREYSPPAGRSGSWTSAIDFPRSSGLRRAPCSLSSHGAFPDFL